jgi:hypothetical protein
MLDPASQIKARAAMVKKMQSEETEKEKEEHSRRFGLHARDYHKLLERDASYVPDLDLTVDHVYIWPGFESTWWQMLQTRVQDVGLPIIDREYILCDIIVSKLRNGRFHEARMAGVPIDVGADAVRELPNTIANWASQVQTCYENPTDVTCMRNYLDACKNDAKTWTDPKVVDRLLGALKNMDDNLPCPPEQYRALDFPCYWVMNILSAICYTFPDLPHEQGLPSGPAFVCTKVEHVICDNLMSQDTKKQFDENRINGNIDTESKSVESVNENRLDITASCHFLFNGATVDLHFTGVHALRRIRSCPNAAHLADKLWKELLAWLEPRKGLVGSAGQLRSAARVLFPDEASNGSFVLPVLHSITGDVNNWQSFEEMKAVPVASDFVVNVASSETYIINQRQEFDSLYKLANAFRSLSKPPYDLENIDPSLTLASLIEWIENRWLSAYTAARLERVLYFLIDMPNPLDVDQARRDFEFDIRQAGLPLAAVARYRHGGGLSRRLAEIQRAYELTHPWALWYCCRPELTDPDRLANINPTLVYALVDMRLPSASVANVPGTVPAYDPCLIQASLAVERVLALQNRIDEDDGEEEDEEEDEDDNKMDI